MTPRVLQVYVTLASILLFARYSFFSSQKCDPVEIFQTPLISRESSFILSHKFLYFFNKLIRDFRENNIANTTHKSNSNIAKFIN